MANGILKDEATYYGDSEKYIGDSGSSTNMWVIEDTYDFIKALRPTQTGAVNYYMRLISDIDFNEHSTYKKGFTGVVYKDARYHLYGDGHKIRNIVVMNTTTAIFKFQYIENVDFVNLVAINCSVFPITMGNVDSCDFGMFVSDSLLAFSGTKITNCTFNIKGKITSNNSLIKISQGLTLQSCHFNFDVNVYFSATSNTYLFHGYNASSAYTNCYFTGKVKNTGSATVTFSSYNKFTNCYFALEWAGKGLNNSNSNTTFVSCFVDRELFDKNGEAWIGTGIAGISRLTTAQAQDVDYLNSIGFAVVPVE